MTRTQIQLPDDIYARAKKLAEEREIALAELTRRGLEYILSVYAPEPRKDWQPPTPRRLGWKGLTDAQLKEQAQRSIAELSLAFPPKAVPCTTRSGKKPGPPTSLSAVSTTPAPRSRSSPRASPNSPPPM